MVIADGDPIPPHPPASSKVIAVAPRLGRPLHRLAAVVVDVGVVLTPVYVLLAAPLKRALTASVLTGGGVDPVVFTLVSLALAVVIGVVYQTCAHHYYGQTFGKRLFNLRVVANSGPSSLGAQLVRSVTWMFTVALGGVPFLAVFAHARRRPLHDRTGDTLVVTTVDGVDAPGSWTRSLVHAAYVVATVVILFSVSVELRGLAAGARDAETTSAGACEIVGRYADDEGAEHARARLALTLYAAGLADRSCLEAELEREVAEQTPAAPVTYLTQAFVNADDAEVSNAYLDQACADARDSSECALSHVVSLWSAEKWDDVGRTLAAAPTGSGYLEVWGARHFAKQARYDEALGQLDLLMDRPEIADFTLDQRVRALYGAFRFEEAREAYKQAMVTLDPTVARELSAWSCVQEFTRGCGAVRQTSCGKFEAKGEAADPSGAVRLARLRTGECRADAEVDYLELADQTTDLQWRDFFVGSEKIKRADRDAATALLRRVVDHDDTADILRVEALRRLAMIATPAQMRGVVQRWTDFESPAAWVQAGNALFDRLATRGEDQLARHVAAELGERLSPQGALRLPTLGSDRLTVRTPASVK